MVDLISRQAAIEAVTKYCTKHDLRDLLADLEVLPSAQKTGKWQITDAYPHNVYCSECHKRFAQTQWSVWEDGSLPRNYCPNCGARMEREEE